MNPETIYALIADAVYSRSGPNAANNDLNVASMVSGAQRTTIFLDDRNTGLYVEVWTVGTQTVVAFRGTDFGASDYRDWTSGNVLLGTGFTWAGQLVSAIAFVESLKSRADVNFANVVFTGHSLGGGLAGLMAAKYGNEAYVFAPAPFKKTADDSMFIPDGLSPARTNALLAGKPVQPSTTDLNDPAYLQYQQDLAIWNDAKGARDSLVNENIPNIHSFGLVDEVLQKFTLSGPLSYAGGLVGVSHFDLQPDVPFTVGGAFGFDESLAKHSMSLHALLMRTSSFTNNEGAWTAKPIGGTNGLFTKDSALRDLFLITPGVAGLLNQVTTDNTSTGPDLGIMLRALISDINFYSQFYNRFGTWLSTGAVALGKVANSTEDLSVHSGVVKLGLQVVRDALTRTTTGPVVGDKGLNVFGAGNESGPTAPYIRVDLADITATDAREKDPANLGGKAFGIRDINYSIAQAASDLLAIATHSTSFQALLTKQLIGISPTEAKNGGSFPAWSTLIVQAGTDPLIYNAKATGTTADGSQSHVIFGGSVDGDDVKGSTAKDYFIGGDGKDTFESGGGNDLFVGGKGEDNFIARVGDTVTDGIIFLGGADKDTARYGSDFDGITLTIKGSAMARYSGQPGAEIGYGARVDQLIGVEHLEVGKGNHTATFTNAAQKLGMTVSFAGGDVTFLRIQDTETPDAELIPPVKGTVTRVEFATLSATGANHQTLSTSNDFEAAERPNTLIFVNGRQLSGGASFDFDKFDLVSNGNVKPIYLMNS